MEKFSVNTILEDGGYDTRLVEAPGILEAAQIAYEQMAAEGKTPSTVEAACMVIPL